MKRFLIVLLILIVAFGAFAQKPYRKQINVNTGTSTWLISGTDTLYSYYNYTTMKCMRVNYYTNSTVDSCALAVKFQAKGPNGWIDVKTLSITTETEAAWLLTDTAITFSDSVRWMAYGVTGNGNGAATTLKMDLVGAN